jgi:hypothetical protein
MATSLYMQPSHRENLIPKPQILIYHGEDNGERRRCTRKKYAAPLGRALPTIELYMKLIKGLLRRSLLKIFRVNNCQL